MMDPVSILVAERVVERSIIAVFAGISIVLGYSLFKTGIVIQQQGEGEWGKFKIKLLSVGPGIFFALFGTIVMLLLVFRGVTFSGPSSGAAAGTQNGTSALIDTPAIGTGTISYSASPRPIDLSALTDEDAEAITTVIDILRGRQLTPEPTLAEKDALSRALKKLELMRKAAAYKRFPRIAAKYEDWTIRSESDPAFLKSLSSADRTQFEAMKRFLEKSLLTGDQP